MSTLDIRCITGAPITNIIFSDATKVVVFGSFIELINNYDGNEESNVPIDDIPNLIKALQKVLDIRK